ncbi:MAG TPA: ABC transporter permease [Candidatus Limnocylindrales bacterium]|jgi:ABC-2 type transport system permease protein|nr:ABC transporter permease [Candidatus Limnocylindrales bacterium]
MARHDPLLPNAAIVARREYVDRVRSKLYRISTLILMALAVGVALTPIVLRYFDRARVDEIGVIAAEEDLALATVATANGIMNIPPPGVDPKEWTPPYAIGRLLDRDLAISDLAAGRLDAIIEVERLADGTLQVTYRTNGPADGVKSQLAGFTALSVAILDWTSSLPPGSQLGTFRTPQFATESLSGPVENGRAVDAVQVASRGFLGTVFIILMFITILIYGMWVATGVAAEKSSRVMELMISAASPRQLLVGKVIGIGGAGLTQYLAIALPVMLVLAFQDQIARTILGAGGAGLPTGGLTFGLLAAYGLFFLLGFALFALIYAAVGSFVSRPDDLQTLSLPLSLVAMAGYLCALVVLLGSAGTFARLTSLVPPLSPFSMLARLMVSTVQPWEVVLSIGVLIATIGLVAAATVRIYATGVLLYGQRPGIRAFIAAAWRTH